MTLSLVSPAKINLALDVGHPRADGYHEIRTVFCRTDLADELELSLTGEPEVRLTIEEGDAPGEMPTLRCGRWRWCAASAGTAAE